MIISIGEDVEKLEASYIPDGNVAWCTCGGKQFDSSSKVKHRVTTWPNNSTRGYIPKKIKSIC